MTSKVNDQSCPVDDQIHTHHHSSKKSCAPIICKSVAPQRSALIFILASSSLEPIIPSPFLNLILNRGLPLPRQNPPPWPTSICPMLAHRPHLHRSPLVLRKLSNQAPVPKEMERRGLKSRRHVHDLGSACLQLGKFWNHD